MPRSQRWYLAGALSLTLLGCASHAKVAAKTPAQVDHTWAYDVATDARGHELEVIAVLPAGSIPTLGVEDGAAPYVRNVELQTGPNAWRTIAPQGETWSVPECAKGCTLRYRFALEEAAASIDDVEVATSYRGAVEAPPSTWLLHPTLCTPEERYRFRMHVDGDGAFATGVRTIGEDGDTYGSAAADLSLAPYSIFGTFKTHTLEREGATFQVATLQGNLALDEDAIDRWLTMSSRAVAAYYGRFPVRRVLFVVAPSRGDDVGGKTLAAGGASIVLFVGHDMQPEAIGRDWVMTHEMTHLAFPSVPAEYRWLEEGLATYVEPIARAKAGNLAPEEVWRGLVDGLPKGEPQRGDRGLDHTPTWGRTYWGGAMFCLLADMQIREQTGNRKSLEDALRGVLSAGGSGDVRWPLDKALAEGDRATGTHVLTALHAKLGSSAVRVDLGKIWTQLGVRTVGDQVAFDDRAKSAAMRRLFTAP